LFPTTANAYVFLVGGVNQLNNDPNNTANYSIRLPAINQNGLGVSYYHIDVHLIGSALASSHPVAATALTASSGSTTGVITESASITATAATASWTRLYAVVTSLSPAGWYQFQLTTASTTVTSYSVLVYQVQSGGIAEIKKEIVDPYEEKIKAMFEANKPKVGPKQQLGHLLWVDDRKIDPESTVRFPYHHNRVIRTNMDDMKENEKLIHDLNRLDLLKNQFREEKHSHSVLTVPPVSSLHAGGEVVKYFNSDREFVIYRRVNETDYNFNHRKNIVFNETVLLDRASEDCEEYSKSSQDRIIKLYEEMRIDEETAMMLFRIDRRNSIEKREFREALDRVFSDKEGGYNGAKYFKTITGELDLKVPVEKKESKKELEIITPGYDFETVEEPSPEPGVVLPPKKVSKSPGRK